MSNGFTIHSYLKKQSESPGVYLCSEIYEGGRLLLILINCFSPSCMNFTSSLDPPLKPTIKSLYWHFELVKKWFILHILTT